MRCREEGEVEAKAMKGGRRSWGRRRCGDEGGGVKEKLGPKRWRDEGDGRTKEGTWPLGQDNGLGREGLQVQIPLGSDGGPRFPVLQARAR